MYEHDGVLVDISASGARFHVRPAQAPDALLAFIVRWDQENILLRGHVVRSSVQQVAVEFHQLPPHSVDQLQRLTASAG